MEVKRRGELRKRSTPSIVITSIDHLKGNRCQVLILNNCQLNYLIGSHLCHWRRHVTTNIHLHEQTNQRQKKTVCSSQAVSGVYLYVSLSLSSSISAKQASPLSLLPWFMQGQREGGFTGLTCKMKCQIPGDLTDDR